MELRNLLRIYAGKNDPPARDSNKDHVAYTCEATMIQLPANTDNWPEVWREDYEERAAIMQFDGGIPQDEAEKIAESLIRHRKNAD